MNIKNRLEKLEREFVKPNQTIDAIALGFHLWLEGCRGTGDLPTEEEIAFQVRRFANGNDVDPIEVARRIKRLTGE
jgi:hypothetical protein